MLTTKLYPCADWPPGLDCHNKRARRTTQFRPPKRGEWYLSGARVAAYQAKNDLTQAYWIARLVRVVKVTTYRVV